MPPRAPIGLQEEGQVLYKWARDHGATTRQCDRIVELLSVQWMCNLPLPLALADRWESQTRIGIVFCLEDTSNTFWDGCTGCQKEIQLGLATRSIC